MRRACAHYEIEDEPVRVFSGLAADLDRLQTEMRHGNTHGLSMEAAAEQIQTLRDRVIRALLAD